MVRSPAPTSPSTPNATVTRAPQARNWSSPGAPTQSHEAASGPRGKGSIAISNGVLNGDALLHNKLRPIAVVDDQCPGAVAASKIEGAALLAIEARYLAGFSSIRRIRAAVIRDSQSGSLLSLIMRVTRQTEPCDTKYPLMAFEPNS
jgi:hypothetical protein